MYEQDRVKSPLKRLVKPSSVKPIIATVLVITVTGSNARVEEGHYTLTSTSPIPGSFVWELPDNVK